MDTPRDIWHKLDEENLKLHNTLDLLYAMSEAARSDEIDLKRYANALGFVWEHLCDIEKSYAILNEALAITTNDTQASASISTEARRVRAFEGSQFDRGKQRINPRHAAAKLQKATPEKGIPKP